MVGRDRCTRRFACDSAVPILKSCLLTALSVLIGLCLAEAVSWPKCAECAWVALASFFCIAIAAKRHEALFFGLVTGIAYWASLLGWATLVDGQVSGQRLIAGGAVATTFAVWFSLQAYAASVTRHQPLALSAAMLATLWGAGEIVRGAAMPYGDLGASQSETSLRFVLGILGSPGVSAILTGASYCLARTLICVPCTRRETRAALGFATALVLSSSPWPRSNVMSAQHSHQVAVIRADKLDRRSLKEALQSVELQTRASRVSITIFPEAATRLPLSWQDVVMLSERARILHGPIMIGTMIPEPAGLANGVVMVGGDGSVRTYEKRRLVPFGEAVPSLWGLGRLFKLPYAGYIAGRDSATWHMKDLAVSPLICFEIAFRDLARRAVLEGANAIVVPVNDTWFSGERGESIQNTAATVQAMSLGIDVLMASVRTQPVVYHSDGTQEMSRSSRNRIARLTLEPPQPTLYRTVGDTPIILSAIVIVLLQIIRCCGALWAMRAMQQAEA